MSDGLDEMFEGQMRAFITVAANAGQQVAAEIARRRQQNALAQEQEARRLQARMDAERAMDMSRLRAVQNPQWWDTAQPADISEMVQLAHAWRDEAPQARNALDTMDRESRVRYGVPLAELATTPEGMQDQQMAMSAARAADEKQREALLAQAVLAEETRRAQLEATVRTIADKVDNEENFVQQLKDAGITFRARIEDGKTVGYSVTGQQEPGKWVSGTNLSRDLRWSALQERWANTQPKPVVSHDSEKRHQLDLSKLTQKGLPATALAAWATSDKAKPYPLAEATRGADKVATEQLAPAQPTHQVQQDAGIEK